MKRGTDAEHRLRVARVIRHVRDHSNGRLRLEDLARIAEVSPAHFDRLFKRLTNRGAVEHVRDLRLARSAIALRLTDRSVLDIALEADYENPESFSRAFRSAHGQSPSAYRATFQYTEKKRAAMKDLTPTINLVKVPVTDFKRAQAFYRDVLGLEEEFAVEQYGWAQYKTGAIPLCLYVVGMGGGDARPGDELGFHVSVSNAKAAYDAIKSRGGTFACGLVSSDDGGVFFMVKDPDGNSFKIVQGQ
jgi:AraC-like DNA-binding protein/predicted enzyme related to lactoylglutathione lyase